MHVLVFHRLYHGFRLIKARVILKENPDVRMLSRMQVSVKRILHLGVVLLFFLTIPATQSYPYGVGEAANRGCVCHGAIQEATEIIVEGLPAKFESNTSYSGVLRINNDNQDFINSSANGGFRMLSSHGELVFDNLSKTQVLDDGWTHTAEGNKFREWNFTWISPMDNTTYVEIRIYGNAVNGDGYTSGDAWNSLVIKVPGVENFDDLKTTNSPDRFELYEKLILGISSLGILFLAYRVIK